HQVSRNNLETVPAFTLKLVPPLSSRNFLNHARAGQIHRDHRCDHDAGGGRVMERIRSQMPRTTSGRYPRRARTFFVLFSYRHLDCPQYSPELALVDLLDLSALEWIVFSEDDGKESPKGAVCWCDGRTKSTGKARTACC